MQVLLERKRLALGRSSTNPIAIDSFEDELEVMRERGKNIADDGGRVGMNKQTAGTASFNREGERMSFTVEDSDALETQSWAGTLDNLS